MGNCIVYGIIPDTFPYCFMDEDSDTENENVNSSKEEENSYQEETSKTRRTQEEKNPELFKKSLRRQFRKLNQKKRKRKTGK